MAGDPGAVDFTYTTNAGSNGNASLLQNNDARTILNTNSPASNNNGGTDGRALAWADMNPEQALLSGGIYTVTLSGTVKGNSAQQNVNLKVSQTINVITLDCSS